MEDLLLFGVWIGALLGVLLLLTAIFMWRELRHYDFWEERTFELERNFCAALGGSAAAFLIALCCAKLASLY
jgi:hypothetical protein